MDIWECALGFMDSQVLFTAASLGIFDSLDEQPRTIAQIAAHTGLPERSAKRLMTMLCALTITKKLPDGRFTNGPEASEQLVRGKSGYIGAMFDHLRNHLYPTWQFFEDALREEQSQWERAFNGQEQPTVEMYSDPESLRAFMEGMHAITYKAARQFAEQAVELAEVEHIVDIGGASGAFVIALVEQFPHLRATVFDLPQVRPIADDFIRAARLEGRITFHAGDFFNDPFPPADAYSMGFILHDWNEEQGGLLLGKVADATPPGGMLVLGEYLFNDDHTGPIHVARMDLNMLVAAQGRERSAPEYGEWLDTFGFDLEQTCSTSEGKHFMILRQKPVVNAETSGAARTSVRAPASGADSK